MAAPSFYSDPHVQFLSQLLEEIADGHIQIPRFQRPLIWTWEQRRELLTSIRDGIPIGAIMVWRTSGAPIQCYRRLGPHSLAEPTTHGTHQYLLDGVQRLSTLYGALYPLLSESSIEATEDDDAVDNYDDDTRDFEVFYDLESKDFVNGNAAAADEFGRLLMPLNIVLDSVALLRFQRSMVGASSEAAVFAADEIARAFREYKIPIIPITTDDLDMATRTFQRINSQGARMSELHMVHALTWSGEFDLRQKIDKIRHDTLADRGWSELDDDPILKACKAALRLNIYRTDANDVSKALRGQPDILDDIGGSLGRVADFLWNHCGIHSPDLVPYELQIVLLAEALRSTPAPSAQQLEILVAWFWMTTYGELFTGMSGDRAQVAVDDMRITMGETKPTWTWGRPFVERPLRARFDWRSARAKALAVQLALRRNVVVGGRDGTQLLADVGRKALVQIIPWSQGRREIFASPANRFLLHPVDVSDFRDAVILAELPEKVRETHLVSEAAMSALHRRDYLGFATVRLDDLGRNEAEFCRPLVRMFGAEPTGQSDGPSDPTLRLL